MSRADLERATLSGLHGPEAQALAREYRAVPRWRIIRRKLIGLRLFRVLNPILTQEDRTKRKDG